MPRGNFLDERIEIWSMDLHDVSLIKSSWVLYWDCRHENPTEFAHPPWCTTTWLPPCNNQLKFFSKAGFAEIVSVIILILNLFLRKTLKTPFCMQRDLTNLNLTNQGYQYKSFQGHQRTLFQFKQRMNSIIHVQSINHFKLRSVEYKQWWFEIDLHL